MNFWNKLRAATSSSSLATSGGSSSGGKRSKPPRHAESEPNITSTHQEKKPDKKSRSRSPFKSLQLSLSKLFGQSHSKENISQSNNSSQHGTLESSRSNQNRNDSRVPDHQELPEHLQSSVRTANGTKPAPPPRLTPNINQGLNPGTGNVGVENYREKLRANKKESQNKENQQQQQQGKSKKMSITAKDNLAFVKSKLKQGGSKLNLFSQNPTSTGSENSQVPVNRSETSAPKKKNSSGIFHRKKGGRSKGDVESNGSVANSGLSVASEPIMHYGRNSRATNDNIYQAVDTEYNEYVHGFPGHEFNPGLYQAYSASTGQIPIPHPNHPHQHLLQQQQQQHPQMMMMINNYPANVYPQLLPQLSYPGLVSGIPQYQLWESQLPQPQHQEIPHTAMAPQQNRTSHNLYDHRGIPYQPRLPPDGRVQSQPAVNYNHPNSQFPDHSPVRASHNRVPSSRSRSKDSPPHRQVMPDKPPYMRSVSNHELATRHRQQQHLLHNIQQTSQVTRDNSVKRNALRVPLGLQHQFNQPAPVPLQLHYDSSDSQAIYGDPNAQSLPKRQSRSKRRDDSFPRRPKSHLNPDFSSDPTNRNSHVGNRTVSSPNLSNLKSRQSVFRGESDIEDDLDDDVFLDPESNEETVPNKPNGPSTHFEPKEPAAPTRSSETPNIRKPNASPMPIKPNNSPMFTKPKESSNIAMPNNSPVFKKQNDSHQFANMSESPMLSKPTKKLADSAGVINDVSYSLNSRVVSELSAEHAAFTNASARSQISTSCDQNVFLSEAVRRSGQHELQFEKLKQQLNDAMQNEDIRIMGGVKSRKSKSRQNSNLSKHGRAVVDDVQRSQNNPEEHESSPNTNSRLSEPFSAEAAMLAVQVAQTDGQMAENGVKGTLAEKEVVVQNSKANDSNLLNESELNLDTSYTTNMVKIDKFLQTLEPVTEAYLQQNPGTSDLYPKKQRKRKTSSDASNKQRFSVNNPNSPYSGNVLGTPSDKSPIEIERLQQVRRRAAARVYGEGSASPFAKRPVTPPSQRPSRRNKNAAERAQSAPPDKLDCISPIMMINNAEYHQASGYESPFLEYNRRSLVAQDLNHNTPNADIMFV